MDVRIAVPEEHVSPAILNAGLEMNTRVNEALIRAGDAPTFDKAVKNGLRWRPEPPGLESFDHAGKTMGRKWGDCDDLAPHRAATLRVTGEDPLAKAVVYKSGPGRWHAIVQRGSGSLEDPSQTAGMQVRKGSKAEGIPAAVVGCMATGRGVDGSVRPFTAVRRDGTGWTARTDLPINDVGHAISTRVFGASPAAALAGSMRGACVIGHCVGVGDEEHIAKLWALQGLLRGDSAAQVAAVCGVDCTKDALQSLADIAPRILDELQAHRRATEAKGHRNAGSPFPRSAVHGFDYGAAFDRATVRGSFLDSMGHIVTAQNIVRAVHPGAMVVGDDQQVQGFFSSIAHLASGIAKGVASVAKVVAPMVQGVVSLVPGIGTGISAAIGAGIAILEGGGPLEIAVKAAYGAIPIPPGVRNITDKVVDAALSLAHTHSITDAVIVTLRSGFPKGLPQDVFDTLSHIVLGAIHKTPTHAIITHPAPGKPPVVKHIAPPHAPHVVHPNPVIAKKIAAVAPLHLTKPGAPLPALASYYVKNSSVVFRKKVA